MEKLIVLGAGESGVGAALLGNDKGWDVFVSDVGEINSVYKAMLDAEGIVWEENNHTLSEILKADLVIKIHAIQNPIKLVRLEKEEGIKIIDKWEIVLGNTIKLILALIGRMEKISTTN